MACQKLGQKCSQNKFVKTFSKRSERKKLGITRKNTIKHPKNSNVSFSRNMFNNSFLYDFLKLTFLLERYILKLFFAIVFVERRQFLLLLLLIANLFKVEMTFYIYIKYLLTYLRLLLLDNE